VFSDRDRQRRIGRRRRQHPTFEKFDRPWSHRSFRSDRVAHIKVSGLIRTKAGRGRSTTMDRIVPDIVDKSRHALADSTRRKNVELIVQQRTPFPREKTSRHLTPESVEEIRRRTHVFGYRLRSVHVSKSQRETSDPWAERAGEGAFLSYFGPFALPYMLCRDIRDRFADRFEPQSYISLQYVHSALEAEAKKRRQRGQDVFLTGSPQLPFSSLRW